MGTELEEFSTTCDCYLCQIWPNLNMTKQFLVQLSSLTCWNKIKFEKKKGEKLKKLLVTEIGILK